MTNKAIRLFTCSVVTLITAAALTGAGVALFYVLRGLL